MRSGGGSIREVSVGGRCRGLGQGREAGPRGKLLGGSSVRARAWDRAGTGCVQEELAGGRGRRTEEALPFEHRNKPGSGPPLHHLIYTPGREAGSTMPTSHL